MEGTNRKDISFKFESNRRVMEARVVIVIKE